MVMKKPDQPPSLVPAPLSQAVNNPPYPVSPTDEHGAIPEKPPTASQRFVGTQHATAVADHLSTLDTAKKLREHDEADKSDHSESDPEWDSDGWDEVEDERQKLAPNNDIPEPLRVRSPLASSPKPNTHDPNGLPATLRIGPLDGIKRPSQENIAQLGFEPGSIGSQGSGGVALQSQNPYLRYQPTGQSGISSNGSIPNNIGATSSSTNPFAANANAVELPSNTTRSPVDEIAHMSLHDSIVDDPFSPTSKQPPLIPIAGEQTPHRETRQDSEQWNHGMDLSSLDAHSSRNYRLDSEGGSRSPQEHRSWQEQQAWEAKERERKQMELAAAAERAKKAQQEQAAIDEWQRGEDAFHASMLEPTSQNEQPPALPPRSSTEQRHPPPPIDTSNGNARRQAEVETPGTKNQRQRKEHYSIKHIQWYDSKKQGIRSAPILTQNANGPCPLLALVNALVLSTPSTIETPLLEALRTREQVSLGLLLDHVIDELMSDRRAGASQDLPDVGDLYSFLINLHTGMTVNPRFVKDATAAIPGTSIIAAGGFELTRELRLYSTFKIPLIHGWLPPSESRAYAAFERTAKTYDDAQSMQFHEEELEAKLSAQGLSAEEQKLFEDLHSIKDFLRTWPTQLTDFGLGTVSRNLKPSETAIFFRNDHFSTMYKEPRTGQLYTLVTDAGYSRHKEIVWESLVDVNGQGSELFSGDFRPVGNMSSAQAGTQRQQERPVRSLLDVDNDQGWTTVQGRHRREQVQLSSATQATSTDTAAAEQEDHDLALALQLQEEEEDRHRRELEARQRRENELSEQFLSNDSNTNDRTSGRRNTGGQEIRPMVPPRRNRNSQPPTIRTSNTSDEAPPPTYEQAAAGRPYHPPRNHPSSPHAPTQPARPARPVTNSASAYGQQASIAGSSAHGRPSNGMGRGGRRHSSMGQGTAVSNEDKEKCVVM